MLENHDVTRVPTRYGGGEEGRRRARAAALLLLGLPGAAFVYQGQELGLAEVEIPDELRQDPIFFRTNGARPGRDGCRVPIPWSGGPPGFGFTTGEPWLPMPDAWRDETVEAQLRRRRARASSSTAARSRCGAARRRCDTAFSSGATARPGRSCSSARPAARRSSARSTSTESRSPLPDGRAPARERALSLERLLPAGAAAWLRM